ncbi:MULTISPECIES: hypothetical protein [unclassified Streptomyces]|uniref:hypothetical protein n=1 Tax=unclassified Streptomyces TaxID=2593676 RepID=UPI00117ED509|nr:MULTISPECIES: hypothetical protein [unclassified Streptomyces]
MGSDVPSAGRVPRRHATPTESTFKELYATALTCGCPDCGEPLYRENPATGQRVLNSQVAHIHARSEGGPRWDPEMSEEDNRSFNNLIPLCGRHAFEIDATPEHYPADRLRTWKRKQIQTHSQAVARTLSDTEAAEVAAASFGTDDLLERLTALLPFSARSRSRAEALALASNSSRARTVVRLRATPADRVEAALEWRTEQADPVVEVPAGALRVLVAPMGAGKSEEAERWWSEGLTQAWTDPQVEIPVWLEAREVAATLAGTLQEALGADPVRDCRIVLDNLDAVSPKRADQLLTDARRLVATWPQVHILATTRPGAGNVDAAERLDVPAWPVQRGWDLLHTVLNEDYVPGLDTHEMQQLLTSPLQVHALASRLRAGGDTQVSTRELLSGLARAILQREHPEASPEVWASLPRLAASVLDQQSPVSASAFARQHVIWELEATGLVVHDDGLLRFALPLFEQHFAAQALQDEEAQLETAAGAEHFPRWRYAIAFAVETATSGRAEEFLRRLACTNPAAASWVLDETTSDHDTGPLPPASTNGPAGGSAGACDEDPEPALAIGGRLREATLSWLEGLGELGKLLAPHDQGALAPWGVLMDQEDRWMTVAQAREGVLDADLVVRPDIHPWQSFPMAQFHDRQSFPVSDAPLTRWVWSRNRLREPLARRVKNRTLPVDAASPLAAERAWFLAQQIMGKGRPGRLGREISLEDLRPEVDALMAHVETTRWSRWQWGRYTVDSADVRWLHAQLQHLPEDKLTDPRPPADRPGEGRYLWQTYSPELTRSITQDVVRDALAGYRDLVQHNFPRFGAALGLYSIFPVRADGLVIMPEPGNTKAYSANVAYTLRTNAGSRMQDAPAVEFDLVEEPNIPSSLWSSLQEDHASVFHRPAVHHEELSTGLERQATNLAYSWLARDLKAVGWLEHAVTFPE